MGLFDSHNLSQIEQFAANTDIQIYLPGDVIIKQGDIADNFFFVVEGILEVMLESRDFKFYDYQTIKAFVDNKLEIDKDGILKRSRSLQAIGTESNSQMSDSRRASSRY